MPSPLYTCFPPAPSTSRWENCAKTEKRGWWMTQTMLSPPLARWRRLCASWTVAAPSRPEVGSSMKMIAGMATSSIPMFTRFFCPPETPRRAASPTRLSRMCVIASALIACTTSLTLAGLGEARGRRSIALYSRFSYTVRLACTTSSCGTKPTCTPGPGHQA